MALPTLARFMEPGSSMLAAVVVDGRPFAARGWGCSFSEDESVTRVIIASFDVHSFNPNAEAAITIAHVPTLRSAQIKGKVLDVFTAVTNADLQTVETYKNSYFDAVETADRFPLSVMQRTLPDEFSVFTMTIEDMFEQTPGVNAGASVAE